MEVQIRVSGGDEVVEFAELREWLSSERALAGTVEVVQRPPAEGELGGAFDMLAVALGSGGAGVALARSLTVWLQSRRANVSITVTTPSKRVELKAHQVQDATALRMLEEVLAKSDEQ